MAASKNASKQPAITRRQQKENTRAKLLAAALELSDGRSLGELSLREISRAVGVAPTAFYRHFPDVESLGLALVGESLDRLRALVASARTPTGSGLTGQEMAAILLDYVREHRLHFRFLARERFGSLPSLRRTIDLDLRSFAADLAADLSRMPALRERGEEDLEALAALIVTIMIRAVEEVLETPTPNRKLEDAILARTERQLQLVTAGLRSWSGSNGND